MQLQKLASYFTPQKHCTDCLFITRIFNPATASGNASVPTESQPQTESANIQPQTPGNGKQLVQT